MNPITDAELVARFTEPELLPYKAPAVMQRAENGCLELARAIVHTTAPGRDQALALTHLEDVLHRWCRAVPSHVPAGEPAEIASLPPEVRRLLHAVDAMRDQYAEADGPRRNELWSAVHGAADAVWGRHDGGRA
ncbi:Acb2/Tad1 domain-containing protein [Nonomuraea rubra]|uniref:Acb2/Tad1 domain-containing protein n=1 Tax=Nonomuraea rubra TaxID=46180 RepID=UPI0033F15044